MVKKKLYRIIAAFDFRRVFHRRYNMNALATIFVVSATILSAARLARCQADRVDDKFLDPNDYFLAGGDLQDRRRILQDAFNRFVRYNVISCEFTNSVTKNIYNTIYLLLIYYLYFPNIFENVIDLYKIEELRCIVTSISHFVYNIIYIYCIAFYECKLNTT